MKTPHDQIDALTMAGLSKREAMIWIVLSEKEPMHISQLAKTCDLHRPAVYLALESLHKQGLVKEQKIGQRIHYKATGSHLIEKKRALRDKAFAAQIAKQKQQEPTSMPEDIQIFRGKDIARVWNMVANSPKGSIVYRYDGYPASMDIGSLATQAYRDAMAKQRIERFVITNQALRKKAYQRRIECASRMFPGKFHAFEQGVTIFVFDGKIALVDLKNQSAYVILNPALAAYQVRVFKYLFQSLAE